MLDLAGVILESKYPEHQVIIKGPRETVWRDGYPVQEPKLLVLQFSGYVCLLDDAIRESEWTEEDQTFLANALEAMIKSPTNRDIWIHEKPVATPPWPNYDQTHHNQIPVTAQSIGLVNEALMYEQRGHPGGPRESVVKKLESLLEGSDPAVVYDGEDELAAV